MATKRQPSKQKRAAQNRNQRAARAARAANAGATATPAASTASGAGGGSLLGRLRGGSTGTRSAATGGGLGATRARGAALRPVQPPGYRAALSATLAAAATVLLCTFVLQQPVDAQGDPYTPATRAADFAVTAARAAAEQPDATPEEIADSIEVWSPDEGSDTVAQARWPYSLALVLPLVGAGLGFQAIRRRSPSKVVNRALYATLFGAVLNVDLMILFLPVVVAMGVAMFQVRKAEVAAAASAGGDDVIEVDEVDADLDEDVDEDRSSPGD